MEDMQAQYDRLSRGWRAERSASQMTLEKAIEKLTYFPLEKPLETPLDYPESYRGYYSDIALCSGEIGTVGELIKVLCDTIGKTYTGYKGGEFYMGPDTPLWFAPYGACGPRIMDFVVHGPVVRMIIEAEED